MEKNPYYDRIRGVNVIELEEKELLRAMGTNLNRTQQLKMVDE